MANWRHTPRKSNVKATHAITTESDVLYETTRSDTRYENEMENGTAMKSSLKATHAVKGDSKEKSQSDEQLPEHKEG